MAVRRVEIAPDRPLSLRWRCKDGRLIWTEHRNVAVFEEQGVRLDPFYLHTLAGLQYSIRFGRVRPRCAIEPKAGILPGTEELLLKGKCHETRRRAKTD